MGLLSKLFSRTQKKEEPTNVIGKYYTLEDLTPEFCGNSGIILSPLGGAQATNEQYPFILSTMWEGSQNIKKFLPSLDLSSAEKSEKYMLSTCTATELGIKFNYMITVNHIPAGMFIITTPYLNNKTLGYNHWTMDFFLFEMFEGKGVMSIALPRMLLHLKKMGIDNIHLIVDSNNKRCLNLIAKLPFDEIDSSNWHSTENGQKPKLFNFPLSDISFR